jgi:uncharacterized protein (DUF433 family)
MTDQQLLARITLDPMIMVGKPTIKGTRLTVDFILNLLAHGATIDEICDEYSGLQAEDIQACLLFASYSLADASFVPLTTETS